MTPTRSRVPDEAGFSLIELLISTAIMLTVTGAIFSLMNPAQGSAQAQPEVADIQQRMRVSNELLFKEVVMAGAGPYQGAIRGSLVDFFAPIIPRRLGKTAPDAKTVVKTDAITLMFVPNSYSQTTIEARMPNTSAELKVTAQRNCPGNNELCGFTEGMEVMIFDNLGSGSFDMFTITHVQGQAGHLQHRGQIFSRAYEVGASITQIQSNTYFLDRTQRKLMRDDGDGNVVPLVDNVVDLQFDYFGDPVPPMLPKPPLGVANCLWDNAQPVANYKSAEMPTLTADEGGLTRLDPALLKNGPWCGGGTNEFDADLLRIRKIRVTLRIQAALPQLRGKDAGGAAVGSCNSAGYTGRFMCPGTAQGGEKYIPDYIVVFDVTPRNLNLTR